MDDYEKFVESFLGLSGIDLLCYKRRQMERRLTALFRRRGFTTFQAYLDCVSQNRALLDELIERVTINVSEFFRNSERWTSLVPHLKDAPLPIRAWSAACSTGEEPYTLAMVMEDNGIRDYHILATDIDGQALQHAAAGVYGESQVRSLPPQCLARYFAAWDGSYRICDRLKQNIEFVRQNLLSNSYPEEMDLIVCRNVLIYFTEEAKRTVVERLMKSLRPNGLLFVGSTEQLLQTHVADLEVVAPFLYRRKAR